MLGKARWDIVVAIAAAAAAAGSLALPFAPAFDPWAWLVWGRETVSLDLDTTAGPSWKPLPVLVDAPLSVFGDAAPDLWLLVARFGWIAAIPLVWRLAAELGGGRHRLVSGATAALGLLLLADAYTPWLRQFAVGLSEPLLVALCLLAVLLALAQRPGYAIAVGATACLIRPEAWPFLALYAGWACRRDTRLRLPTALTGLAILLAWFAPDLLGAGNPLEGAERARGLDGGGLEDVWNVVERAFELVPPALWPLALVGALARGPNSRARLIVGAGSVCWILLVAAMAGVGFAGLPRFMAPAAAAICALGGVGIAHVAGAAARAAGGGPVARRALLGGAALLVAATMVPRLADLPGEYEEAERRGGVTEALLRTADAAGRPAPACGAVVTDDPLVVTALAWRLELPLADVRFASRPPPGAGLAFANEIGAWTSADEAALGVPVASDGPWVGYRPC